MAKWFYAYFNTTGYAIAFLHYKT